MTVEDSKDPQPTKQDAAPMPGSSVAPNLPGHLISDTHETSAGDQTTTDSQKIADAHVLGAVSGSNPPDGQRSDSTQRRTAVGDQTTESQAHTENQRDRALGSNHQQAIKAAPPIDCAPAGSNHPPTIGDPVPKGSASAGSDFTSSHAVDDTHSPFAAGEPNSTDSHLRHDAHPFCAVRGSTPETSHIPVGTHSRRVGFGPILADPILGIAADVVGDLEAVRVANENRFRTLTATTEDGHGLSPDHPDVARLAALVDSLAKAEHQAILNLQRVMRKHPLGAWVKAQPGVGEKQAARLLATIRDPYWNDLHNRPRTVSELRSYCGFGDAGTQVRRRGQKSNWSDDARKRAWLIAASCVKQPPETRWRKVYDEARVKYADAVHKETCVRCGPKNKPAQPGSPLSLGHQHAIGLRAIAKAILKDLWLEARALHQPAEGEVAA